MTLFFENRFLKASTSFGLALALAATVQGCGSQSGKKDPPEFGIQRFVQDSEPMASLAPRWMDFNFVPPSFPMGATQVVPIDIETIDSALTFDVASRKALGQATLTFATYEDGLPMLDLASDVSGVVLDGVELAPADLVTINLPDQQSTVRVLQRSLIKGENHSLSLTYALPDGVPAFSDQGVSFGLFMSDLRGRAGAKYYLERYVPANFEYDQFRLTMKLSVQNHKTPIQIFTNGAVTATAANQWDISFPEYFTASSPYLHLTERAMAVQEAVHQGVERSIPITIYGPDAGALDAALDLARRTLKELESDYGAYPHASLLIYLNNGMRGGMEYSGATVTSLWALPHEITHSWFARSVMPADGNSGWIDEAIASWRDDGYQRYKANALAFLPELAAGSLYQRYTNYAAYSSGADLLSSIDSEIAGKTQTNLKTVLAKFYKDRKNQIVTTRYFQKFIESESQLDFSDFFAAYAYEKSPGRLSTLIPDGPRMERRSSPFHAPPLSADQLRDIL